MTQTNGKYIQNHEKMPRLQLFGLAHEDTTDYIPPFAHLATSDVPGPCS